jgi:hypothetical protein
MNSTTGNMSKFVETCFILNDIIEVIIKFPSTLSVIPYIVALVVNVTLVFTTIFLNGVTVATIWNSSMLKERVSNFTILIQSVVDLANGIFFMVLSSVLLVGDIIGSPSCITVYITKRVGFLIFFYSMTAMTMMSFERYMGVLYPFVHRVEVTKSRLFKYFISICSLQTLLHTAFSLFNRPHIGRAFFAGNLFLFLAFTALVYTRIFYFRTKNNRFPPGRAVVSVSEGNNMGRIGRFIREFRIAKSCFLVVLSNLICCFPSIIIFTVLNLKPSFSVITLRKWSYILSMLNSTVNSLIFFWRNKELRNKGITRMRNLLNRIFMTRSSEVQ